MWKAVCALGIGVGLCGVALGEPVARLVAVEDEPLNAGEDAVLDRAGTPAFGRDGEFAFLASVRPSPGEAAVLGVWRYDGEWFSPIAQVGDDATGAPFAFFAGFTGVSANRAGDVVFVATLTGPGVVFGDQIGFWRWRDGELELLQRLGDPAPGVGIALSAPFSGSPENGSSLIVGGTGEIAYLTQFSGGGTFGLGAFRAGGAFDDYVLADGFAAPTGEGDVYVFTPFSARPVMNDSGLTAATGNVRPNGTVSSIDSISLLHPDGQREIVVQQGDDAVGSDGLSLTSLGTTTLNDDGTIGFLGLVGSVFSPDFAGAYVKLPSGEPELVVAVGEQAPGLEDGTTVTGIGEQVLTPEGDLVFATALMGSTVTFANASALYRGDGAGVELIARSGDFAPGGQGARYAFGGFGSAPLAFASLLSTNQVGLWIEGCSGEPELALVTGQMLTLPNGVQGTVDGFGAFNLLGGDFGVGTGGEDGRARPFDDRGTIGAVVEFAGFGVPQALVLFESACCPPDLNSDGLLNTTDINLFVSLFLADDLGADLTGDGMLNTTDINLFVQLFLAGC